MILLTEIVGYFVVVITSIKLVYSLCFLGTEKEISGSENAYSLQV